MQYAASYQAITSPDPDAYWDSLTIAVGELMRDGQTADDVRIDAARIAYELNRHNHRLHVTPAEVCLVADDAEYYVQHDELP